jgi:hypothetical protein
LNYIIVITASRMPDQIEIGFIARGFSWAVL